MELHLKRLANIGFDLLRVARQFLCTGHRVAQAHQAERCCDGATHPRQGCKSESAPGLHGIAVQTASKSHEARIRDVSIYRAGDEVLSFQEIRGRHAAQDGAKSSTPSVRQWIASHCNDSSPETIITDKAEYRNWSEVLAEGNWEPVASEGTRHVAGFADQSRVTNTDNPFSHETRDWTMNVIPDPAFMYLLGSGMKRTGDALQFIPWLHNEWETGSFPGQWLPFWGQYVELHGRHIWDVGHSPVTAEFHPPHTVVRQHTTAAPVPYRSD